MSNDLHHSEWLDLARKVPVGQKRRHFHGAESTKALDVWNNPDSWSCYCHRCHTGAKVYKQFIEKVPDDTPLYRKYLDYKCLITLDQLYKTDLYKYKRVIKLLHDKGVSTVSIQALNPMYNTKDDRLVFRFKGVDIGRDCTDRSPAKWLVYHSDNPMGYVYLQGQNSYQTQEPVILTEDLFSAQKIRYYTGWSTLCLLGTSFKNDIAVFLLDKIAVCATDGDKGGWKARSAIKTRCELFGIPFIPVDVPTGLDPKDIPPEGLIKMFNFLEK